MIKISIFEINKKVDSIEISGHANYADYGKDIVCAGISSLIYACINSLNNVNKKEIILKEGFVKINNIKEFDLHDQVVIEVLINGFEQMSLEYPKNISIERK